MKKGGESVFANNILRQFLKISVDATETYASDYSTSNELALVELVKYIPKSNFVDNYKNAVDSIKSINYEADESPITFYLFNLEKKGGIGKVIERLLENRGFVNLVKNYIHPHDVHAYYFDITTTRYVLYIIKTNKLACMLLLSDSLIKYFAFK